MKPLTLVICATIVAAMIIGTCGCTSPATSSPSPSASSTQQTPTAQDYAQNYLNVTMPSLGVNETLENPKVIENGTDTALLSYAITNKTSQPILYTNGFTTTYGFNVKRFSSVDEATKFYEQTSLGYTPYQPTLNASIYKATTGNNPTINNESRRLNSITQASVATQQDEFVTWGIASVTLA